MTDHVERVLFEGDSTSLARAAGVAHQSVTKMDAAVAKSRSSITAMGEAIGKNKDAIGKFGGAAKSALPQVVEIATASGSAAKAATGLASSVAAGAKAFGPWGLAIGLAADALIALITKTTEAAEASKRLQRQLAEEAKIRANLFAAENETAKVDDAVAQKRRELRLKEAQEQLQGTKEVASRAKELIEIENKLARGASGENALMARKAAIEAANAESLKEYDLAKKIRREEELRVLGLEKLNKGKKGPEDWEIARMNRLTRAAMDFGDGTITGTRMGAKRLGTSLAGLGGQSLADAQSASAEALRKIELERASEREMDFAAEMDRIDREREAKVSLLDFEIDAARQEDDILALKEQRRQAFHDAELARIAVQRAEEAKRIEVLQKGIGIGEEAANAAVFGAIAVSEAKKKATQAAKLQGKTDAEAARAGKAAALEQTAAQLTSIRNLAIARALEQTAMGLASLAVYDFPAAGNHFAAAAAYGALAGVTAAGAQAAGDRAFSMQGQAANSPFGGGGGFGVPAGGAANSGPTPIDSSIPGSPGPRAPSASSTRQSGGGGGVSFAGATFNLYGAGGRNEFIRQVDADLADLSHRRRRSG